MFVSSYIVYSYVIICHYQKDVAKDDRQRKIYARVGTLQSFHRISFIFSISFKLNKIPLPLLGAINIEIISVNVSGVATL